MRCSERRRAVADAESEEGSGTPAVERANITRMPCGSWLETYRGTVFRWEVDHNDHFTVAYYLARIADAGRALLHALGAGPAPTVDCFITYRRELRTGDVMHVQSGVIGMDGESLLIGHKLFDSASGELCTTVEQRVAAKLGAEGRAAAEARRVSWDGPAREVRPRPRHPNGLRNAARDTVKPDDVDATGQLALQAAVQRFSASNAHVLAAFGLTPAYMREQRRGFSTFEFQLAMGGEVRPGDPLVVRSGLVHVGKSSMQIFHVMTDARTGSEVATLHQSGVHFDQDRRRPVPLPEDLRARALEVYGL
jgi:acyl-CoA thioesterase FadM